MNGVINLKRKKNLRLRRRLPFYICLVALPSIQFLICYVYVNINSFVLAFQSYSAKESSLGFNVAFAGVSNFVKAWGIITESVSRIQLSVTWAVIKIFVGITLALIFSFYLYKRYLFSGLFKVILFMPQILSPMIFSLLFKYIAVDVYKYVAEELFHTTALSGGLLGNEARLGTTIFFNLWIGFGVNVLLFSGSMSSIDKSLVESAQLDGTNLIQEFIHLTIPMIWPTLVTFLITALAGIFTDQMNIFTLFGDNSEIETFGYYLFVSARSANLLPSSKGVDYSMLSAVGLMMTAVLFPITMLIRHLLIKFGPSAD